MLCEHRSKAEGMSDLLNYAMIVAKGVILQKDGSFCAGWSYQGHDLNSASNNELEHLSASINHILSSLGDGWMLHSDLFRCQSIGYTKAENCHFPEPITRMIDEERRFQYETEGAHFESDHTLILTFLPPSEMESKVTRLFIEGEDKKKKNWTRILENFQEKMATLQNLLSSFIRLERLTDDRLLTRLHRDITGQLHPMRLPKWHVYLDTYLGSQDFSGGLYPRIGDKYLRIISIDGFPMESEPGVLKVLGSLSIQFRWSNRFIFLDPSTAVAELKKYRKNWFQKRHGLMALIREVMTGEQGTSMINQDALDMTADAEEAVREAESGLVRFGYYTSVLVLYEEDKNLLEDNTKLLLQELNNRGFSARVETVNAIEAYLGSLPGQGYQNVRRPLLHTLNLADMLPLTGVWAGLPNNPCRYFPDNSPPLLYAATEGTTPFRFNLHVRDVGHVAIFGSTGYGKSTLLGMICAQFFRYRNAQVFFFDKGYSSYALCKAMGGTHYDLMAGTHAPAFYPLANIHISSELDWACEWIEECLTLTNFVVTNLQRNAIREGLIRLSHSQSRTLTELQSTIQDREIQQALEFFTLAGEMGSVLDAAFDDLDRGRFQVFEMENLIQKGVARLVPTVLYIFHQIEKRLTENRPTLIVVEEGHHFLRGKFGRQLDKWLLELRKKNAAVIFVTQDLSHILNSEYKQNLNYFYTKIFLPNKEAANEINAPLYRGVGLTDKQIDIIKNAIPKKHYYVTSHLGHRLIDLGLGRLSLSFVGVDGADDRRRIDELIQQHGNRWVRQWLTEGNMPDWAAYWENLSAEYNALHEKR
jgi:type IV secretion/conjugal transfer VirB4 family ATPase